MPLTIAHPAAVIPIARHLGRGASLSGLVIGSMSPDFAYLLPLGLARMETHDPWALLWFCLPMGWAAYILHHLLLGPLAARLLPDAVASRLPPAALRGQIPAAPFHVVTFSLLLGAVSHLLVDSMTHRDGFIVQLLPILQMYIGSLAGYRVHVFKVLQYVFSAIGIGLICAWVHRWMRRTPPAPIDPSSRLSPARRLANLGLLIALPIAAGFLSAAGAHDSDHRKPRLREQSRLFLKGGGAVLCVSWVALGIVLRARRTDENPLPDKPPPHP